VARRLKSKRPSDRGSDEAGTSQRPALQMHATGSPSEVKQALLLEHLSERIDQLFVRLEELGNRIDSQQTRVDTRIVVIEAELKELPRMIERGMRAALAEEAEGN
jgi:hypothetical protein